MNSSLLTGFFVQTNGCGREQCLDTDDSESLSCDKICEGLRKMVIVYRFFNTIFDYESVLIWFQMCDHWQDFKPRIHISESDFATITLDGKLCNSDGNLEAAQFETVFRRLLKLYTQRQVILSVL